MDEQTRFFIGTSGWTYEDWKGDFYPANLPKTHWFEFYAQHFNAVEINATFYRTFKVETYQKWREKAPPGFRYAVKMPRIITHRKMLKEVSKDIADFCTSAEVLGESLGMYLLQLAPHMALDFDRLRAAIKAFPEASKVAVEFRHPKWECEETWALLKESGAAYVCADSPKAHLQEKLTGKRGYLRLHGRRHWYADNYTEKGLHEIAKVAQRLAAQDATEVYIFFNNDVGGYAHRNGLRLREMMDM